VARRSKLVGEYVGAERFEAEWREVVAAAGGAERIAGRSVEGRPLWAFELGARAVGAPVVLLTALIHGVEVIGSVTLLDVVRQLAGRGAGGARTLLDEVRLVVMPILNADAFAANMERVERGHVAFQRKNARGVDLNRNFTPVGTARSWHPFAGSRLRLSPHYRGPHPFSEPEACALRDVALACRPRLAVGFHSFGNMLLYPWAHSRAPNPRFGRYLRLGEAFARRLPGRPYRVRQASAFYPTSGDLDDWLDAHLDALAFTIEVSALDARLLHPRRAIDPFCWMNPTDVASTVADVSPGVVGLLAGSLAAA
jgi:carboxypeptidase T